MNDHEFEATHVIITLLATTTILTISLVPLIRRAKTKAEGLLILLAGNILHAALWGLYILSL